MKTLAEQISAMGEYPPWNELPWQTSYWDNERISVDEVSTADFPKSAIVEVVTYLEVGDHWDGNVVGIVRLEDGRVVGWESSYGPTGSGFSRDAYGGDAVVIFAKSVEGVTSRFTERGRDLLASAVG